MRIDIYALAVCGRSRRRSGRASRAILLEVDGIAGHLLVVLQIFLLENAGKHEGEIAVGAVEFRTGLRVDEGRVHSHRADLACTGTGHELLPKFVRRTEQTLVVQSAHRADGQVNVLHLDCFLHLVCYLLLGHVMHNICGGSAP